LVSVDLFVLITLATAISLAKEEWVAQRDQTVILGTPLTAQERLAQWENVYGQYHFNREQVGKKQQLRE
jgi:hypothetical protein